MKIAVYCLTLAFLAVVASAARPSVYDSPVVNTTHTHIVLIIIIIIIISVHNINSLVQTLLF